MSKPVKNVRWHIGRGAVPCLRKKTGCLGGGAPRTAWKFSGVSLWKYFLHFQNVKSRTICWSDDI